MVHIHIVRWCTVHTTSDSINCVYRRRLHSTGSACTKQYASCVELCWLHIFTKEYPNTYVVIYNLPIKLYYRKHWICKTPVFILSFSSFLSLFFCKLSVQSWVGLRLLYSLTQLPVLCLPFLFKAYNSFYSFPVLTFTFHQGKKESEDVVWKIRELQTSRLYQCQVFAFSDYWEAAGLSAFKTNLHHAVSI